MESISYCKTYTTEELRRRYEGNAFSQERRVVRTRLMRSPVSLVKFEGFAADAKKSFGPDVERNSMKKRFSEERNMIRTSLQLTPVSLVKLEELVLLDPFDFIRTTVSILNSSVLYATYIQLQ
ncbi:uncharacterized [Tachysurus ichikawai]